MLKSNDFGNDIEDVRSERANLMSENIDSMAATIGVSGPIHTWARNVDANWKAARITADTEGAQPDEAYQEYHLKFNECREKYVIYKELLLAIIYDLQDDDELIEEYNIKGRTPRSREGLTVAVGDWRTTHDRLTAAGDSRVVPEAYVVEMETLAAEFDALWHVAIVEKDEAIKATAAKEELFAEDTDKFRIIYRMAVIAYGPDGSDLRLLGFVPASEVWTPGMPEPGEPGEPGGATYPDKVENLLAENITYPIIVNKVSWDVLAGVNSYSVKKAEVDLGQIAPPMPEEYYAQDYMDNTPVGDNDIMPGKTYYYWVCGVDETGVEGEWAICSCDYV